MHALESAWESVRRDFDSACDEASRNARQQLTGNLNQVFRRLRNYENENQWLGALRDGVAEHAGAFAIFTLQGDVLRLRSRQDIPLSDDLQFSLASAHAFSAAVDSRDSVVALRTAGEVGPALATTAAERAHLFPLANAGRVVAILLVAENRPFDRSALELITSLAAVVLERQANQALHSQISPALIASVPPKSAKLVLPAWADLEAEQRSLHLKAQRFSRVTIAGIQLARPEAARAGREQKNVYMFLQSEIDKARETYGKQFMKTASMVDYLHLELVRSLAAGDQAALGADYPGQLV